MQYKITVELPQGTITYIVESDDSPEKLLEETKKEYALFTKVIGAIKNGYN